MEHRLHISTEAGVSRPDPDADWLTQAVDEDRARLLVTDRAGIYLPQEFAEGRDHRDWHIDPEDWDALLDGPDNEDYWEAWEKALSEAFFTDPVGHKWSLHQDTDLWMVRED